MVRLVYLSLPYSTVCKAPDKRLWRPGLKSQSGSSLISHIPLHGRDILVKLQGNFSLK